jgi:hypothetical protein
MAKIEMKILMVGSSLPGALENYYLEGLLKCRCAVTFMSADEVTQRRGLVTRVIRRFSPNNYPGMRGFNQRMIEVLADGDFDVLLVFKGMEIWPETLRRAKVQFGVLLVNYNPDNPIIYSGVGSGNRNMRDSLGLYDIYCTYDKFVQQQLEQMGVSSELIPFGFSDSRDFDNDNEHEQLRTCFIGNADDCRADFLIQFSRFCYLDIYGNGWGKYVFSSKCRLLPPVYEDSLYRTLRSYRVQLNLMRIHNKNSHNMRSFDIVGSGSIGLMPRTTDHERFFDHGKSVFLFDTLEDAVALANDLLSRSASEAAEIRKSARWACRGCDYHSRTLTLLEILTDGLNRHRT